LAAQSWFSGGLAVKILLADDDPVCRALLETTLVSWGYDVNSVSDGVAAWRILEQKDAPLLAIVDWMMPKLDGLELCRRVRERPAPYVYLVLVTARDCKEDIIQGIAAGADDYLTKPVDLHELEVRLRAGRRVLDLQQALLEAHDRLRVQATHDPLTGLWNRAWILEKLHRELARSDRHKSVVSVVLTDIDNFKHVNDEHGHLAGDAVLREIAQRIQGSVREYDRIGRYGGDEILVVLPECDAADALRMAQRIRERIVTAPMETSEGTFNPTISMGVATSPAHRVDPMCMIRAADLALYRAKSLGRNCVETATSGDLVQVLRAGSVA
jgi:two-component system cell cycle response regulator